MTLVNLVDSGTTLSPKFKILPTLRSCCPIGILGPLNFWAFCLPREAQPLLKYVKRPLNRQPGF